MTGGDTLTCGVCSKDFALADIVKFIQHKVLTCNKENFCKDKSGEEAEAATNENGTSDGESNNNHSSSSDNAAAAASSSVAAAADSASKENGSSEESEGDKTTKEKDSEVIKMDLESSSPVTSTPDSLSAALQRKRKADCVDADTNTIITGKNYKKKCMSQLCTWLILATYLWSCVGRKVCVKYLRT